MKVKDFVSKYLIGWVNQRLPSALVWAQWLINYLNLALNDIYTFEGRYWPFMYKSERVHWSKTWAKNGRFYTVETEHPIIKVSYVKDLDKEDEEYYREYPKQWEASGLAWLKEKQVAYEQYGNTIQLPANEKGYIVSYIAAHKEITNEDDEIDLPHVFHSALYLCALSYLYPIQWQYGENKEVNCYQRARQALTDLAKSSMMPLGFIKVK